MVEGTEVDDATRDFAVKKLSGGQLLPIVSDMLKLKHYSHLSLCWVHFPIGSQLQQRTETRPSGEPGNWPPFLGREVSHSGAKVKRGEGFSSLRALREAAQRAARERSGPQDILVQGTSTMDRITLQNEEVPTLRGLPTTRRHVR